MRPPTMISGNFRVRYRIRNKVDKLIIIDCRRKNKWINEISVIYVNKCGDYLMYKLLSFIYTEWYKKMYDFLDKIKKYDNFCKLNGMIVK